MLTSAPSRGTSHAAVISTARTSIRNALWGVRAAVLAGQRTSWNGISSSKDRRILRVSAPHSPNAPLALEPALMPARLSRTVRCWRRLPRHAQVPEQLPIRAAVHHDAHSKVRPFQCSPTSGDPPHALLCISLGAPWCAVARLEVLKWSEWSVPCTRLSGLAWSVPAWCAAAASRRTRGCASR